MSECEWYTLYRGKLTPTVVGDDAEESKDIVVSSQLGAGVWDLDSVDSLLTCRSLCDRYSRSQDECQWEIQGFEAHLARANTLSCMLNPSEQPVLVYNKSNRHPPAHRLVEIQNPFHTEHNSDGLMTLGNVRSTTLVTGTFGCTLSKN